MLALALSLLGGVTRRRLAVGWLRQQHGLGQRGMLHMRRVVDIPRGGGRARPAGGLVLVLAAVAPVLVFATVTPALVFAAVAVALVLAAVAPAFLPWLVLGGLLAWALTVCPPPMMRFVMLAFWALDDDMRGLALVYGGQSLSLTCCPATVVGVRGVCAVFAAMMVLRALVVLAVR